MSMLSVATLAGLTLAHVKLDIVEMAKVVVVSSFLETGKFRFLSGLKTCYLASILAYRITN